MSTAPVASTAVATTQKTALTPMQKKQGVLKAQLDGRRLLLVKALPSHINPEAFWRKIMFACFKNQDLLDCDPMSVIEAVTKAAQLGLDPTGLLGEGYLIPFKGVCEFVPGYQGLISLARRSGHIATISVRPVFEGDRFECFYGLEEKLVHEPDWENENIGDPTKLKFVYAVAKLTGGAVQFDVMSRKAIMKIKAASPGGNSTRSPWNTHFVEMALKTVIRHIFKVLPKSADIEKALALGDGGTDSGAVDLNAFDLESLSGILPAPPKSGIAQLKAKVAEVAAPAPASAPTPAPSVQATPVAQSAAATPEPAREDTDDERVQREQAEEYEAQFGGGK